MRPKHRNDHKHGKQGYVSGNPRFKDTRNGRNKQQLKAEIKMCDACDNETGMIDRHQQRLKDKFDEFVAGLETEPPVECEFKPGDVVKFTNEFGVEFEGFVVLGFAKDTEFYGRFIYAALPGERAYNGCAYWFPKLPGELTLTPANEVETANAES